MTAGVTASIILHVALIDRRRFVGGLAAAVLTASGAVVAQPSGRAYRVGVLRPTTRTDDAADVMAVGLPRAMREVGYNEGQNLVLIQRFADNKLDRLPGLARELVDQRVDVILAVSAASIRAAKAATSSIPIVSRVSFRSSSRRSWSS